MTSEKTCRMRAGLTPRGSSAGKQEKGAWMNSDNINIQLELLYVCLYNACNILTNHIALNHLYTS